MDSDRLQEISERDQLWASLRGLRQEIEGLAAGTPDTSGRHERLMVLLARIVLAEMNFRAQDDNAA